MKPIKTIQQAEAYVKHTPKSEHLQNPDWILINNYTKTIALLKDSKALVPDSLYKISIDAVNKFILFSNYHPEKVCPCNLCLAEKQISTPTEALSSMAYYMEMMFDLLEVYDKNSHSGLAQEAKLMLKEITEKFLTEQNPPGE